MSSVKVYIRLEEEEEPSEPTTLLDSPVIDKQALEQELDEESQKSLLVAEGAVAEAEEEEGARERGRTFTICWGRMTIPIEAIQCVGLLILSNCFMTVAWYGHLKYKSASLYVVILASWGIALFEYIMQVPANRIGHSVMSAAQLKTIQEVISLTVFSAFSVMYLGEELRWNHALGFFLILLGAVSIFYKVE